MTAQPTPAAVPLCGITRSTGRIEWVCVRPVHDTVASKNRSAWGDQYVPQSERHHFVRKYPARAGGSRPEERTP